VRHDSRKSLLAFRDGHHERLGFNPLEHSESRDALSHAKSGVLRRPYQSKRHMAPHLDTYDRVFGKDPYFINPDRTQHIYDQDMAGKHYNIVSHTEPELWRPKFIAQERVDKKLAHPSQQSLERGRNLQGYVEPSNRCTSPFLDPWY
jgi:hypothetical protein